MKNLDIYINEITESAVSAFARSYSVLDYQHNFKKILSSLIPKNDFSNFTKEELHSTINYILTNRFKGESGLKAKLVAMFVEKDVTAAFEIRVNKSRVDFLTVNGDTKSYEIKSGIDNLNKLAKQVSDYERVFEFNYIVIDEKHLQGAVELIPYRFGILVLEKGKLVQKRKSERNCCLEPEMQLQLFTKKEITQQFKGVDNTIAELTKLFTAAEINESFKMMLKKRYEKRWQFLKQNMDEILPIDYQYFFHHNILPKVIYGA